MSISEWVGIIGLAVVLIASLWKIATRQADAMRRVKELEERAVANRAGIDSVNKSLDAKFEALGTKIDNKFGRLQDVLSSTREALAAIPREFAPPQWLMDRLKAVETKTDETNRVLVNHIQETTHK